LYSETERRKHKRYANKFLRFILKIIFLFFSLNSLCYFLIFVLPC
jgi:hypothetical protein